LDKNQTKIINKNWGYSGPGTEIIVRDTLVHNGGLALQLKTHDSYVGWSVEQHYGGIGMLFVHPEFRRQGFASTLVKLMARRAIDKGIDPFAIIEVQNNKSRQLFEKLEFEIICIVHWVGVRKEN
jgi:ribosomal protein S18 acetylase RimI-like enzyme